MPTNCFDQGNKVALQGIRVNALVPGPTKTEAARALFNNETIYHTAMKIIPMQRHVEPNEEGANGRGL